MRDERSEEDGNGIYMHIQLSGPQINSFLEATRAMYARERERTQQHHLPFFFATIIIK